MKKLFSGANITGLVFLIFLGFPVYWMVTTSFKSPEDVLVANPSLLPTSFSFQNYFLAFQKEYFVGSLLNSAIVVSITVVISLLLALTASFALARMKFRGKSTFTVLILLVQMVPLTALIIPLFLQLSSLGLVNTQPGLIITYIAFVLPFVIWTLRGFLLGIPQELEEAALVDGCSRPKAFIYVIFPLMAPGIVATGVYAFIQAWNEFLLAYIIMASQENQTLPVWLAGFTSRTGTDWGPLMAASVIAAIPAVVLFLVFQKRLAVGTTAGAVKG
jgi:N,N'-diacetylchitobiose transport system permease protein